MSEREVRYGHALLSFSGIIKSPHNAEIDKSWNVDFFARKHAESIKHWALCYHGHEHNRVETESYWIDRFGLMNFNEKYWRAVRGA